MNRRIIGALVKKDIKLFFRNRFFAFITVLALVSYIAIYFAMPDTVDEDLSIAIYAPILPPVVEQMDGEGILLIRLDTEDAVKEVVSNGDYIAGIVIPDDVVDAVTTGAKVNVDLYFASDTAVEIKDAITILLREIFYLQSGQILPVEITEEILGRDMAGMQIPYGDRMLPLFAVFIVLMEMLGLASLISEEVEARTVQALLITPMSVAGFFTAKGITGVLLAFSQAVLFMAATGGLSQEPILILVTFLLGAIFITGVGFIIASLGKDMLTVMGWGFPVLIILMVPAFGVIFPGSITDWAKIVPSYYMVDTVHLAANYGVGWSELWDNILILLGFDVLFAGAGILALRRKLR